MSISLYEFLKEDVKKMVLGIGLKNTGNIYPLIMEEAERSVITLVLHETNFNLVQATKILGISRCTLYRRIKKLGISVNKKLFLAQPEKEQINNECT